MALTMDDAGRIGVIAVYTGDEFPEPANQLADLRATVKRQTGMHSLESAAVAYYERMTPAHEVHPLDSVCVQYEARVAKPLRISFPYRIKVKLSGDSVITQLAPVTRSDMPAEWFGPETDAAKRPPSAERRAL